MNKDSWRIFGELPSRAPDWSLLLWVRSYPKEGFSYRWTGDMCSGLQDMWADVIEEIEFRGLLPLQGWREWSEAA